MQIKNESGKEGEVLKKIASDLLLRKKLDCSSSSSRPSLSFSFIPFAFHLQSLIRLLYNNYLREIDLSERGCRETKKIANIINSLHSKRYTLAYLNIFSHLIFFQMLGLEERAFLMMNKEKKLYKKMLVLKQSCIRIK